MKIRNWFDKHFEELLLTICLLLILCVSFLQVIIRKIPGIPALTWAEEFCRYMWVFSVFLSLPYCIRKGNMLTVNLITQKLPEKAGGILRLAVDACVFFIMFILMMASIGVVSARFSSGETSPAMLWPMWIIYAIMLLGYALAVLRAAQVFFKNLRAIKRGM